MEKTMNFAELQELREQFKILNDKLEKQAIINDNLIQESIKNKLSYVDKTFRLYVITEVIISPLLIALLVFYKATLAMWIFIAVALIVEMILYRREYRKLDTKRLMSLGHIDAVERVATFKKNLKTITYVMLIPAIILFILFVGLVTDYKFDMGSVIYYSIFIMLALTYEFVRSKKMFSRLDAVLKQIKELRSE